METDIAASRFLFRSLIAIDANFRLKNRLRGGVDPGLGTGWSYFVEDAPYKSHLLKFVRQEEVSQLLNMFFRHLDRSIDPFLHSFPHVPVLQLSIMQIQRTLKDFVQPVWVQQRVHVMAFSCPMASEIYKRVNGKSFVVQVAMVQL
jgi:hypothetical protein